MPKAYSGDLRVRVIAAVVAGASRREAGDRFEISPSSSIRWLQRWEESGNTEPKPRGGSTSPLEEFAPQILALVEEQPDLDLEGVRCTAEKTAHSHQPQLALAVS